MEQQLQEPQPVAKVPLVLEESSCLSEEISQSLGNTKSLGSFSVYEMTIENEEEPTGGLYAEEWETQFLHPRTTMQDNLRAQERKRKKNRRTGKQRALAKAVRQKDTTPTSNFIQPQKQRSLVRKRATSPGGQAATNNNNNNNNSGTTQTGSMYGTHRTNDQQQEQAQPQAQQQPEDEIWVEAKRRAERLLAGKTARETPNGKDNPTNGAGEAAESNIFDLTRVNHQKASSTTNGVTDKHGKTKIPKGEALYGVPSVSQIGKSYAKSFDSKSKAEKTAAFKHQNAAKQRAIDSEVVVGREEGSENLLKEIDVIKYICLRERLKGNLVAVTRQLKQVCHSIVKKRRGVNRPVDSGMVYQVGKQQEIVVTLIHELQRASIAVVTAITRWRESVHKSQRERSGPDGARVTTFRWKGANYLLTMQKDLRFLSRNRDERLNRRRAKKVPANRGVLSGGIGGAINGNGNGGAITGGVITTSEPGSESEATLAEKFVNPVAYWLGFEPEQHPFLVPPPNINVLDALQQERVEIELLAATQLKNEQENRANALRAAHMARISGVRMVTPLKSTPVDPHIEANQPNQAVPRTNVSTADSTMSITSNDMLEEEESMLVEEPSIAEVAATGTHQPGQAKEGGARNEGGEGEEGDEEAEPVVEEAAVPWTFWVVDLYHTEQPLAKPLPDKSHALHGAALQVLREERDVEHQWRNMEQERASPDSGYDPVARIADQGGIDLLLHGVMETKLMEDTEVVSRLRNRQQNRNLRKADATMRPSHPDHVDAGATVALGVSTHRIRNTAERAIEDSRPHVLPVSPGAPNTKLQGSVLIGELPMNRVRRQNAIVRRAAALIQAMCRGVLARSPTGPIEQKRVLKEQRKTFAATGLQSLIRGRIARQEVEELRFNQPSMEPNVAATMIQGMVRTFFARKSMEIESLYLKTVLIKAAAEGKEARDAVAQQEAEQQAKIAAKQHAKEAKLAQEQALRVKGRRKRKPVLVFSEEEVVERPFTFVEKKRAEVEEARAEEAAAVVVPEEQQKVAEVAEVAEVDGGEEVLLPLAALL